MTGINGAKRNRNLGLGGIIFTEG